MLSRLFVLCPAVILAVALSGCVSTPDLIVRPLAADSARRPAVTAQLADALRRAEASYDAAWKGRSPEATRQYDLAVGDAIAALSLKSSSREWVAPVKAGPYQLRFPPGNRGRPYWTPSRWAGIIPAAQIRPVHAATRVTGAGLGFPVILYKESIEEMRDRYPGLPHNGIHLPGTAVLVFGETPRNGGPRRVELLLVNPRSSPVAKIAGRKVQLAYDLTAPMEMQFRNEFVLDLAWSGLRFPDRYRERAGIFGTQPYDRDKIPVVFVHGLNSDPHVWMDAMNAVMSDPVLRSKFQIWYFIYPTGLAVPASARLLRNDLVATRQAFDPQGRDPGMNQTVLIGHSMGGLLSRMQVIDSGDDIRKAYLSQPIDQLNLSAENRARLRTGFYFKRLPWITRVAFLATPHRGSQIADFRLVRFVLRFIRLTGETASLIAEVVTLNEDAINPDLRKFNSFGARSVETLSPRHPLFRALEARPIGVPYHSVIGDRGRGDSPNSSDGIVPYRSSHLAGAQSEKIVPARHGLTEHAMTVEEIRRILRDHLRQVESGRRVKPRFKEIRAGGPTMPP